MTYPVTKGAIKGAITIAISKNIRVSCIVMSVAKLITFVFLLRMILLLLVKLHEYLTRKTI
ncbi:hypothetical protein ECZU23_28860 [Escherichia coli]|nr:hypothetical protein ECZU03_32920 [Escherichia coli]GHL14443.1 hypothetical protein ECZU23_28860 [Escherichia coli]GMB05326.1 hypothetical protein GU27SCV_30430 [Escherichia coli]